MNPKTRLVLDLAEFCRLRGIRLPVKVLAGYLNAAGHRTSDGKPYKGKRGTNRLVRMTYHRLHRAGRMAEALMVAATYAHPNGAYAF